MTDLANVNLYLKKLAIGLLRRKSPFLPTLLKPFSLSDLKPIPPEWTIHPPDFVGVAAGKSGTSWWYSLISKHPQVVSNRLKTKELHYFDHFKYRLISESEANHYCQAFASPEDKICGEWSPNYLTHPFCIENLAKSAPNTKVILLLRNPIDRLISQMNFQFYSRINSFNFTADERYVYELYTIYLNSCLHSYYTVGLKQVLKFFDRSQILVLQYEKCKLNPLEEIQRTYKFLGIDAEYTPQEITKKVNHTKESHFTLNSEEKIRLFNFFEEEMKITHQLFPEIDLSLWLDEKLTFS